MKTLWKRRGLLVKLLVLAVAVWGAFRLSAADTQNASGAAAAPGAGNVTQQAVLPNTSAFRVIAETAVLRLKLDYTTGHFMVEDKRGAAVFRSYPDPDQWDKETIGGLWKQHLISPLMLEYTDFTSYHTKPKMTNFTALGGKLSDVTEIPGGVRMVFDMPALELAIPVELRIQDDYVETTILDEGIKEGRYSMTWLRLYPFFGAEQSVGQDGYMLIPDGSGALIRFGAQATSANRVYEERVYGPDQSFNNDRSSRLGVTMPVFGMKSGGKAFLAVLEEGAEYAKVYASPAGVYSQYNWVTGQMLYRSTYYQTTNRSKNTGFVSYNKEQRFGTNRRVKYFLLEADHADYAGMAQRYRKYLMEEQGLSPISSAPADLPLFVSVIGGGQEKGVLGDRFLPVTPFAEALNMLETLQAKGVRQLDLTYLGWQQGGFTSIGGYAPPEERLGGEAGLKAMIAQARAVHIPVRLAVNFEANTKGNRGFFPSSQGMRDMAGSLLGTGLWRSNKDMYYMSYSYTRSFYQEDLQKLLSLGADGVLLQQAGGVLNSDFNTKYGIDRTGAMAQQTEQFRQAREVLGVVHGQNMNFYAAAFVEHIHSLYDDYSYDLFTDRAVPFAQIALHGLKSYSSGYDNQREQSRNDFLKDIEYGAAPSYLFTHRPTRELASLYGMQLISTTFDDWVEQAAVEYARYNEALGDVQTQFITGHRELAPGVRETAYSGGKRIIVNYRDAEYRDGSLLVPARDFAIVKEEAK